jgi:hypothetical protein
LCLDCFKPGHHHFEHNQPYKGKDPKPENTLTLSVFQAGGPAEETEGGYDTSVSVEESGDLESELGKASA